MTDAIAGTSWLAVNAVAVSAAWRVARRALPDDSAAQSAMHTLVILWSAIVSICLLLGGLGVLTAGAMGGLMLAVAAAVYLLQVRRFSGAFSRCGASFAEAAAKSSDAVPEVRNATEGVPHRAFSKNATLELDAAPARGGPL